MSPLFNKFSLVPVAALVLASFAIGAAAAWLHSPRMASFDTAYAISETIGPRYCPLVNRVMAPPVSAQNPPTGFSRVILMPMVRTMRQPPKAVPTAMAALIDRRKDLIISCGFFSVALARSFWSLAASTVILTVGEAVLVPALMSTVTRLAAASERGTYMALLFALQILGLGVAPLLGGFLLSVFSGITALLWLVVGLAGLLCVFGYYALGRVRKTVHTCP